MTRKKSFTILSVFTINKLYNMTWETRIIDNEFKSDSLDDLVTHVQDRKYLDDIDAKQKRLVDELNNTTLSVEDINSLVDWEELWFHTDNLTAQWVAIDESYLEKESLEKDDDAWLDEFSNEVEFKTHQDSLGESDIDFANAA